MGRLALAAGGALVAALVAVLLVETRAGDERGAAPGPQASRPVEATPAARAADPPAAPDSPPLTPDEHAEAPARAAPGLAAERPRPSDLSPRPDVVDRKLTARPMRDARKAYQGGEYEVSLARAQDVLALDPESDAARVLATLAACALGRPEVARAHAARLDDMRRKRVANRCDAFGVALDDGSTEPAAGARAGNSGEGARPTLGH
ncbi:MAG TPA: hypothetical protein VKB80_34095 [Kofleriaceae bacterium]|nr:hypothetical protein [Kofleriaceae bacterium]